MNKINNKILRNMIYNYKNYIIYSIMSNIFRKIYNKNYNKNFS